MKNQILFSVMVLLLGSSSWALNYSSEIFEMKTDFKNKLFELKVDAVTDSGGVVTSTGVFTDAKTKEVAFREVAKFKDGELLETNIEQKQTGEKGQIKISGDNIEFSYTDARGKEKHNIEKISAGKKVLASANFIVFIRKYWKELKKDKEMSLRLAVWDRYETVGFDLTWEGEEKKSGQSMVKLKLKPSSFLIAALVDPLYLWFSPDGQKLLELRGRVAPKIKVGQKWKPMDGDVKYSY